MLRKTIFHSNSQLNTYHFSVLGNNNDSSGADVVVVDTYVELCAGHVNKLNVSLYNHTLPKFVKGKQKIYQSQENINWNTDKI